MYISTWKKIKWWLLLVYKLCCESVLSNFILVLPRNNSHIHQMCTHCILGDSVAQYVASIAFLSFLFLLEILHPCDTGWYPRSCALRGCQSLLWRQTNREGGGGGGEPAIPSVQRASQFTAKVFHLPPSTRGCGCWFTAVCWLCRGTFSKGVRVL